MINYFNFKKIDDKYLITNDFGKYAILGENHFRELLSEKTVSDEIVKKELIDKQFIYYSSEQFFTESNCEKILSPKEYLFYSTQLFILVVTTACNHQCKYCQAQNGEEIPNDFMDEETARKAADIILESPSRYVQIEFQGGEPLLNFRIIRFVVEYLTENNSEKNISFSIVTNLTLLTEEMIDFIKQYHIGISTSVDGNAMIHNYNRPYRNGNGTYNDVYEKIKVLRNHDIWVGAIETTTQKSLDSYKDIIDAYVDMGFRSISLRALTPLGCANKKWDEIGYSAKEFVDFYKNALEYIIDINKSGQYLDEGLAKIFLSKIMGGCGLNYMELRSPCGATVGQVAFYYDGNIYTCDEGRMIAEMGDRSFLIGTVDNSYDEMMNSKVCKGICTASILEGLTSCADCVYQPYCGVCPAVNYSLYGDIYEKMPKNYRCEIYGGMLDVLFNKIMSEDDTVETIFRSWIS